MPISQQAQTERTMPPPVAEEKKESKTNEVALNALAQTPQTSSVPPFQLNKRKLFASRAKQENSSLPGGWNAIDSPQASTSLQPPPTPRKKQASALPNAFNALYLKAKDKSSMTIHGKEVELSLLSEKGTYMVVYSLKAEQRILPSVDNEDLVVKIYNEKQSACRPQFLESLMGNSIANYYAAKDSGLKVATLYNVESAPDDHFFLQERIPHQIDVTNEEHMKQVQHFFLTSLKNRIILDLLPPNLRVNKEGSVVLIDFVEEPDDGQESLINQALRMWADLFHKTCQDQERTLAFLDQLTKGFDQFGYNRGENRQLVERLCPIEPPLFSDLPSKKYAKSS
jgi:hypothetical protein